MAGDWYRRTDWSPEAQSEFERRLARARAESRPQYLRIQAVSLWEAGVHPEAANALLRRVLDDYDDDFDKPLATELLGRIAASAGRLDEAEHWYRALLSKWPSLERTTEGAEVGLADVLSRRGTAAADQEALRLLDSFLERDAMQWKNLMFLWHLTRLRIAERRGESEVSVMNARAALELAGSDPQFPRHPGVGVVTSDDLTLQRLRRLAQVSA